MRKASPSRKGGEGHPAQPGEMPFTAWSGDRGLTLSRSVCRRLSGDNGFEPVGQLNEFQLARLVGAVKGIADDDLAQFG